MTLQQKQYVGAGIAVLIVVIIAAVSFSMKKPAETSDTNTVQPIATTTPETATTTAPVKTTTKPKTAAQATLTKAQAYEKAKLDYAGRRIQFNDSCQAIPSQMTFKTGTAIMLDNQANVSRVIRIGGTTFNVNADDYLIMKVTSKVLPNTVSIDCGGSYNIGTIVIQQ